MSGHGFQKLYCSGVPPTKRLDNEGLEENSGRATVLSVFAHLLRFPMVNGGGGNVSSPVDDGILGWRNDADIESGSSTIRPAFHEDIRATEILG